MCYDDCSCLIEIYRFKPAVVGAAGFGYFAVAFIALLVASRIIVTKLNTMLHYRDEIKNEVKSMKINTVINVLIGSLDIAGAIGANVLSACLLA